MRNALVSLPELDRELVLFHQEQDLSFEEIGQRTRRSTEEVRRLWGLAILHLSRLLRPNG